MKMVLPQAKTATCWVRESDILGHLRARLMDAKASRPSTVVSAESLKGMSTYKLQQ
jgi:hypothetical protein